MKYFFQLGLAALLLFSMSAALSVWLYQSRQPMEAAQSDKGEKNGKKVTKEPDHKESSEPKTKTETSPPAIDQADQIIARERAERLTRRALQMDMILRDLRAEREAVDALLKQVIGEMKQAAAKATEVEAKATELEKKKGDLDISERKNIDRIASLYDSMTPEAAAPILKQMADSGRMDTAVKILAQMKERSAAKVLAELNDPTLAAQLLDEMRKMKARKPIVPVSGP